jgi:nuclear transport factor 2 (NTF2) superfamily protein
LDKLKALWEKIKKWAKETALPWLKKSWLQIVNVIIVLFAYGQLDNAGAAVAAGIVGLWGFILLGYWIFWKLFGMDKVVKAFIKQQREKKKK